MSNHIFYSEENGVLRITIKPALKMIIRIIYTGLIVLLVGSLLVSSWLIYQNGADLSLIGLFTLAWLFIIFFVFRKLLNRLYYSDVIELSKAELQLIRKKLFVAKSNTIPLSEIKHIYYHDWATHSGGYDVTGLHFAQSEVDFTIATGKLVIETRSGVFYLGKDISSWDGEELLQRIEAFAGHRFPIQKPN